MKYKEIFNELDEIINSDFNMSDFRKLNKIWQNINYIYGGELLDQRLDAKSHYDIVKNKVNEVLYAKLKEKLDFEDEVINQLLAFTMFTEKVEDLYVLDGIVIAKMKAYVHGEPKDILFFPGNNEFNNIATEKFNNLDNNEFKTFLAQSLSNLIKPLIKDRVDVDEALVMNNDTFTYNVSDLNVYINSLLSNILSDNTGSKVHKILVTYEDLIFYFDMKLRDNYIIISQNDFKIHSISEMLNQKNKVKSKN